MNQPITIQATINTSIEKTWTLYTTPECVTQWNFAHESWHCPSATNELKVGAAFHYTMAAKDGSFEFDFWGTYDIVDAPHQLAYTMGDGRKALIDFLHSNGVTTIVIVFEPESENSNEMQEQGWQAILDNFKKYAETHS